MSLPTVLDAALRVALFGCVLLALAHGFAWLLRGRSAAVRHAVWTASLFAVILLPVAVLVPAPVVASVPSLEQLVQPVSPLMPASADFEAVSSNASPSAAGLPQVGAAELTAPALPASAEPYVNSRASRSFAEGSWTVGAPRVALIVWAVVTALLVLRLLAGVLRAGRV
ncbi:MAG: hypothetical protein AAGG01_23505, partial [Planctomycetota bacterium]